MGPLTKLEQAVSISTDSLVKAYSKNVISLEWNIVIYDRRHFHQHRQQVPCQQAWPVIT